MSTAKHYFLITLFTLCSLAGYAKKEYSKSNINSLKGLSQNDVQDILQDSYGFVWIATNDGLNRYDGFEFKTFNMGENGINSSLILCLAEDKNRNIWIGTADRGIFIFNRKTNTFYSANQLANDKDLIQRIETTRKILIDSLGRIWVFDGKLRQMACISFDYEKSVIENIRFFPRRLDASENITGITEVGNRIYASTYKGLLSYDHQQENFRVLPGTKKLSINSLSVRGDKIFMSAHARIHSYDTKTNLVQKYNHDPKNGLLTWCGDTLWIVSGQQLELLQYHEAEGKFVAQKEIDHYQNYFPNVIKADPTGAIWTGFLKAGIKRYEVNKKPFHIFQNCGNNHILPIFESIDKELFIGTEGSGIYQVADKKEKTTSTSLSLSSRTIFSIAQDPESGDYFVSTNQGVYRTSTLNKMDSKALITNTSVRKLLVDGDYLWMASYSRGLWRMNLKDKHFVKLTMENSSLRSNIIRNIIKDRKGNLWIATSAGIVRLDASVKHASFPSLVPILPEQTYDHYVIPIQEDHLGNIWYGTLGNGLFKLQHVADEDRFTLSQYNTEMGIPSNTIKTIVEDDQNQLWFSTNRGITHLNPETAQILNYDVANGLQDYEFNELSGIKLSNGNIYFGGVNGFNYFDPRELQIDSTKAIPVLTDFKIFNKSVSADSSYQHMFNGSTETLQQIHLHYNQNSFTFAFSALHFSNSQKNSYAYKLEGFDNEWYDTDATRREAAYTNISPGNYTFKLKVSNGDGVWNETPLCIGITVHRPFWSTWIAQIVYLILLCIIGYEIFKYYRKRFENKNAIALSQFEKKKMEEMLEIRTRLFTNISHEFRTPLTLIISSLQKMANDSALLENKKWADCMQVMSFNGEALMRLINEFLSFSKREEGNLNVHLAYNDLNSLCKLLISQFAFWSEQKGVSLAYHGPNRSVMHHYDNHMMQQIIYNLLSNAIKNTPDQGKVTLSLEDGADEIIITIQDSGLGISEELQKHIFKRFYSVETDASKDIGGTGIGLSLTKDLVELHDGKINFTSSPNQGTTFTITIPKAEIELLEDAGELISTQEHAEPEFEFMTPVTNANTEAESSTPATDSHFPEEKPTLLIVDDHKQIQVLLRELFEDDFNILTADHGVEGLNKAQELVPDIIISDVMMPQMNGLEMCERIKTDVRTSHIPIIMLSAKASPEDKAQGYRHRADGYVAKPFNNHVLIERVNSILFNRRKIAKSNPVITTEHAIEEAVNNDITTNTDKIFMKKLTDYIEENVHNSELVVNDLCEKMGVTPIVLNKKLKSLFNMTANALIRSIRLKRAASLLKTGRYTVADVTYDVGFSDLRYFRECFKKEFGMLPQEYKDQNSNKNVVKVEEEPVQV